MATKEAKQFRKTVPASDCGNLNTIVALFNDGAANGDVINLRELPAGSRPYRLRVVNDALGAGTTISLGYQYRSPSAGAAAPTAFKAATATSSAGSFTADFHLLPTFTDDVYITATVGGGSIANALNLTVFIDYEFVGTM